MEAIDQSVLKDFHQWKQSFVRDVTCFINCDNEKEDKEMTGEEDKVEGSGWLSLLYGNRDIDKFVSEHRIDIQNYSKIVIERDMLFEENQSLHKKIQDYLHQIHEHEISCANQKEMVLKLHEEVEKYKQQVQLWQTKYSKEEQSKSKKQKASIPNEDVEEWQVMMVSLKALYDTKSADHYVDRRQYDECVKEYEKQAQALHHFECLSQELHHQLLNKYEEIYLLQSTLSQYERDKMNVTHDEVQHAQMLDSMHKKESHYLEERKAYQQIIGSLDDKLQQAEESNKKLQEELVKAFQTMQWLEKRKEWEKEEGEKEQKKRQAQQEAVMQLQEQGRWSEYSAQDTQQQQQPAAQGLAIGAIGRLDEASTMNGNHPNDEMNCDKLDIHPHHVTTATIASSSSSSSFFTTTNSSNSSNSSNSVLFQFLQGMQQ